jgi:hypothetical protein
MRTLAIATTLLLGVLSPAFSSAQTTPSADQPHAASPAAISQALQERVAQTDAQRDRVRQLLQRPEVRELAGQVGLDLRQAESAVGTLEGQQLADAAAQAERIENALAGGQSRITISTTFLIIALLLLIVLILALK